MKNQPITAQQLKGFIPALATLLTPISEVIDYPRQDRLIEDLIAAKADGIVVMGTTGQAATFDYQEHIDEVVRTFELINGRVPVIVGAGSNDTLRAIHLAQEIEKRIGPTTFLEATGYYIKSSPEAAAFHFLRIAEEIRGNMILYNVPGRVYTKLNADTIIHLANWAKGSIIGLKQADPSLKREENLRILENTDRDWFNMVSGEDDKVYELMELGATGVISATGNCCPRIFKDITSMFETDRAGAKSAQDETKHYVDFCFMAPGNNPTNLAYLFNANVRGANLRLENCLNIAEKIYHTTQSKEAKQRVEAWEALIATGDSLIRTWDKKATGIDLAAYRA